MILEPWWKRLDWWLVTAMFVLLIMGLTMIASSTLGTSQTYFANQLLFSFVGVTLFVFIVRLPVELFIQSAPVFYGLSVLLLLIVDVFGKVTHGASSWLYLGPFALQPSELSKLGLALMLALLVKLRDQYSWSEWRYIGLSVAALLFPLALTVIQPDFGSGAVLLVMWLVAIWVGGLSKRIVGLLAGSVILVGFLGWFRLEAYQQQRIFTFLNPTASPLGSGYNVLQSMIAVGSGRFFGQGWGRGTQGHLQFLPERHTDFIFAMLSEEWGFIGSIIIVSCFFIIAWRCLSLMWRSASSSLVLVASLSTMILFQAVVNIAMNIGIAPVTGIPLPLVSYGGSSLLTVLASFALLLSLALEPDNPKQLS
jgi:rod shape determining protein RodA